MDNLLPPLGLSLDAPPATMTHLRWEAARAEAPPSREVPARLRDLLPSTATADAAADAAAAAHAATAGRPLATLEVDPKPPYDAKVDPSPLGVTLRLSLIHI